MAQNVGCQLKALVAMPTAGGSIWDVLRAIAALMFLYRALVIIYRVFLSPLAKFPRPKLDAATSWYEAFLDLRSKNFPNIVSGLHENMVCHTHTCIHPEVNECSGPIVRVNPTELSIRDAEYYNELYVPGGKRRTNLMAGNRARS